MVQKRSRRQSMQTKTFEDNKLKESCSVNEILKLRTSYQLIKLKNIYMKKLSTLILLYLIQIGCISCEIFAQVGINTDDPHPSSVLHVFSSNRGILIPSLTSGNLISSPADGLLIYNSSSKMFDFFNKAILKWQPVSPFILDSSGYSLNVKLKMNNTLTINSKLTINDTLSELRGYGTIPIGGIIMWSGTKIPNGWALCDGHITSEGYTTPDLRGRFIVGSGNNPTGLIDGTIWDSNYLTPGNLSIKGTLQGKQGGIKLITMTTNQMPAHSHFINLVTTLAGEHTHPYSTVESDGNYAPYLRVGASGTTLNRVAGYYITYDTITRQTKRIDLNNAIKENQIDAVPNHAHLLSGNTSSIGSSTAIENRPPYYVLAFIMRVK